LTRYLTENLRKEEIRKFECGSGLPRGSRNPETDQNVKRTESEILLQDRIISGSALQNTRGIMAAVEEKKSGHEEGRRGRGREGRSSVAWISGTKMDGAPTGAVETAETRKGWQGRERQKGVPWRVLAELSSSAAEFE